MWRRVEIRNYRSIDHANVELAPFTAIVGRNGSGKSNFADALLFASEVVGDADTAVQRRGGIVGIRRWRPTRPVDVSIDVRASVTRSELDTDYARHQFTLRSGRDGAWHFHHETIEVIARKKPAWRLERTNDDGELWSSKDKSTHPLKPPLLSKNTSAFFAARMYDYAYRFMTGAVRRVRLNPDVMRQPQVAKEGWRLDESGSNLAVAFRNMSDNETRRITRAMAKIIPGLSKIDVSSFDRFLLLRFHQKQPGGQVAEFSAMEMSEGALRALGIMVASQQVEPTELLLIEEPEVSIHVGAANVLFDVLKDASKRGAVLVTTHSADLLDAASDEEILVADYVDGVTRVGPLAKAQRQVVRDGLFSVAELMRSEPLRIEGVPPRVIDARAAGS